MPPPAHICSLPRSYCLLNRVSSTQGLSPGLSTQAPPESIERAGSTPCRFLAASSDCGEMSSPLANAVAVWRYPHIREQKLRCGSCQRRFTQLSPHYCSIGLQTLHSCYRMLRRSVVVMARHHMHAPVLPLLHANIIAHPCPLRHLRHARAHP